jgi:uncharacterized protein involved in outer membrane biogenesis
MSLKRFLGYSFGIVGAVVLALMLYLAFGDLGRHKARIEAMVTQSIGRPFAIDGPFELRLIPVIDVSAERVRLGNVLGGSQPQMVQFGKAVVQIRFWSLISGPPEVKLFELHDATVLLERAADGSGNWVMGAPEAEAETAMDDEEEEIEGDEAGELEVPVIIHRAQLNNVRLIYREPKKSDRVVLFENLTITPGQGELLALDGKGKLDIYPMTLKGELGTLKSLLAARDMRLAMQMSLGKLALDVKGIVGSLEPLDGVDLTLKVEHPELDSMLTKLELPVIAVGPMQIDGLVKDDGELTKLDFNAKVGDLTARTSGTIKTLSLVGADLAIKVEKAEIGPLLAALELPAIAAGPMKVDTRIKDVGKHRQLDFEATLGDLAASVKGTLKTRGLVGSDLKFEATAADAARLANVFEVSGVPAAPLTVSGHTVYSRKQVKFDALTAAIAGASLRLDGTMQHTRDRKGTLKFQLSAGSLAKLRETLPDLKVTASGALELEKGRLEAKELQARLGEQQLAGSLLLTDGGKHIEAQISSPRLDLTPFMPEKPAEVAVETGPVAARAEPEPPKKKFVFDETPFPFDKMKDTDAKLHLVCGELVFGERSVKDLDSNVHVDHGKITFDMRAAGAHEGTLQGAGTLVPAADGTADLALKIDLSDVRANLGNKDIARADVPPVGLELDIKIHGNSPRQMASGANGYLLLTQGAGKMRSGIISAYGGGVLSELTQKLNPFAKDDPFMKLDCTIARADIVNGEMTVTPLVLQTEKVTITAHGNIDLRTEKLLLDFNTRPRKGIGVSPGMFTNPLIRLEGTLVSPRIGVGAKGVASGALAAATGGATVVAGGFFDRMKGEKDICKSTLAAATDPVAAKSDKKRD